MSTIIFFFNDTATTEIYTLSLHDALPISCEGKTHATLQDHGGNWWRHGSLNADRDWRPDETANGMTGDRKSTRLNSSHSQISYAVFCLKKKNKNKKAITPLNIVTNED